MATLLKLACVHPLEQVQVLLNRAVAVGAVGARSGGRALLLSNLLTRLVVNICLALLNQADGGGLVSSKRRLHVPPNISATPKSMQMALAWPMCR